MNTHHNYTCLAALRLTEVASSGIGGRLTAESVAGLPGISRLSISSTRGKRDTSVNYTWREIYQVNAVSFPHLSHEIRVAEQAIVTLHKGPLDVYEPVFPRFQSLDLVLRGVGIAKHMYPEGTYLVLDILNVDAEERPAEGHERASEIAALLSLRVGWQAFEKCIYMGWTGNQALSPKIRFVAPIVLRSPENELVLPEVKAEGVDKRVRLALRWYMKGVHSVDFLDAYIAYWIGLEVFPMEGTRNLRKLVAYLSNDIMDGSVDSATLKEGLQLGRLYGLRGEIVHHGTCLQSGFLDRLETLRCLTEAILGFRTGVVEASWCQMKVRELMAQWAR